MPEGRVVDLQKLMEKWSDVLDAGGDQMGEKMKKSTALMLENEQDYINEQTHGNYTAFSFNQDAGYSGSGDFFKVAVPMVRRTFPELIAHEIVGVQPMTGPVGLAFALRFRAGQEYAGQVGTEVGYNTVDPNYTGPYSTSAGEALGSQDVPSVDGHPGTTGGLGIGQGKGIKELNMTIEKAQVEAETRKLRSRWSLEVAQDLKAMHGLDLENEMMDILAYEITAEIDREIIGNIRSVATASSWDYENDSDGRWEAEKNRNMFNLIIRKANEIAITTRRGAGNFIVCNPRVSAAIETLPSFAVQPVDANVDTSVTGVSKIGSLDNRMSLYRDTFATNDEFLVGFKGPSEYDTGIVYLPYIQLLVSRATFEDSYNPSVGLMSRYAIHNHLFGAENYYRRVTVSNMP